MTTAEHNFNIWKVLGILLAIALWIIGMNDLTDYCFGRSNSAFLDIVGILGSVIISWLAYKCIRWIIEY